MAKLSFFWEQPSFIEPGFKQYTYDGECPYSPRPVADGEFVLPPLPRWSEPEGPPSFLGVMRAFVQGRLPRIWFRTRIVRIKTPVIRWPHPEPPREQGGALDTARSVAKELGYI